MSSIQNFFTSRDNNTDGNTYVGQLDRLWYNPTTNSIFVSDGTTPGGNPVDLAVGANAVFNGITANSISVNGNITFTGNISPAADNKIGGIAPGPGITIGTNGILTIDSANLPVSFGNFYANNNILSIVNVNENMILSTEGSAEIQLIGNVGFYKPDGLPPNVANRFAFFNSDGQAEFFIPDTDPAAAAFKIIGSSTGTYSPPLNTGVMLQITGQQNDASRFYNDSVGSFAAFVGRRINGTIASPTAVQAGDEFIRISATGYDGTTTPGTATSRIVFQAIENITPTAKGSNLSFWTAGIGSNVLTKIATVDVANGVNATKFTTSDTVSATGNITGGNVLTGGLISATGNITGGNVLTGGLISATGNITSGNVLTGGLISATGNINAGNLTVDGGNISMTGNIIAGYLLLRPGGTTLQALSTQNDSLGTNKTTGTITIGGPAQTGTFTLSRSTVSHTLNVDSGITETGNTKTINFGTAGAEGSTTTISVGPTVGNGTATFNTGTTVAIANTGAAALSVVGNITGGNILTAGLITATGNITGGNVVGFVRPSAGTTSLAPLVFTSGNLETSPTSGAMSYDGRIFYATPQNSERGLIVTEQVFIPNTDYAILNQTAVQSMFGVSVSLSSNTRYAYRILSTVYKTANNIVLQYATSGNVTLATHKYQTTTTAATTLATLSTPSVLRNILTTGFDTAVTVSAALNSTGYFSLQVTGTLGVTTGGTWNPLIGFTGLPGVGSYVAAGSSIEIWPIGPTGANVSIGNWT